MFRLVFCLAIAVGCGTATAQPKGWPVGPGHTVLTLWPDGAPGGVKTTEPEKDTWTAKSGLTAGRPLVRWSNVSVPTLTLFSPTNKNTGAAVIVIPGGSYSFLAIDLEGTEVCDWLVSRGITCVLLKYRVPDSGPYPQSSAALQDAQRAVGMVRAHAVEWKIDAKRVGVLGFSAGGHLAAFLSTHFAERLYPAVDAADQLSCKPDFVVMVYPAYLVDPKNGFALSPDLMVTDQAPPTFLVQAEDDPLHVENATAYFMALKNVKVPVEMHLYAKGGHGYGLRRTELPVTRWPDLVDEWMKTIGVIPGA
jgi:acetyl esterase/lipase